MVDSSVTLTLTKAQVAHVVRDCSTGESVSDSLLGSLADLASAAELIDAMGVNQISQSTLRSLLVFAAFPTDGTYRSITDVARQLGYNASTTHRYVTTWMTVGLLEQDPRTRRYRRASANR